MDNQTTEKKKNVFLISALVFIVLFVLPLGSIYFMNSGLQYRKSSLAELENLGQVGEFNFINQNNISITPNLLRGRVAVVNFISENDSIALFQTDRIAKVHQSYNETEDVLFLSLVKTNPTEKLLDQASRLGISDHQQWYLLGTDNNDWNDTPEAVFHVPDPSNTIALIDTSLTVRRLYDINSNQEMGRLVEQIAIVIPKQKRRGM